MACDVAIHAIVEKGENEILPCSTSALTPFEMEMNRYERVGVKLSRCNLTYTAKRARLFFCGIITKQYKELSGSSFLFSQSDHLSM